MQARATPSRSSPTPARSTTSPRRGDDIDRQLSQIQQSGQVDDELAKLKAELGQGDEAKELPAAARRRQASRRRKPSRSREGRRVGTIRDVCGARRET